MPKSKTTTKEQGDRPSEGQASRQDQERASGGMARLRLIDQRIRDLGMARGDPGPDAGADPGSRSRDDIEEWKWHGHAGLVARRDRLHRRAYKKVVKLTFAQGAELPDPSRLFNSSLEGNTRRAIDIHEGEKIDADAFKALVKAAVAQNGSPRSQARREGSRVRPSRVDQGGGQASRDKLLLSGGNPQIAKADGDAPVQAYIAAMPGWKSDLGKRLDALIVRNVPNVRKAVKWNSPFYGIEGQGWFLSFHVFTRYVKVTFFRGTSLRPVPPGGRRSKDARWIDIHEGDELDEAQMATWVKQAAALPGFLGPRP